MLFGGEASEGLEPVGVMGCAVFDGPVLHRRGDDIGQVRLKTLAVDDGPLETLEDVLREALLHDAEGENIRGVEILDAPIGHLQAGGMVVGGERSIQKSRSVHEALQIHPGIIRARARLVYGYQT